MINTLDPLIIPGAPRLFIETIFRERGREDSIGKSKRNIAFRLGKVLENA